MPLPELPDCNAIACIPLLEFLNCNVITRMPSPKLPDYNTIARTPSLELPDYNATTTHTPSSDITRNHNQTKVSTLTNCPF
jgi:hypothetical protein